MRIFWYQVVTSLRLLENNFSSALSHARAAAAKEKEGLTFEIKRMHELNANMSMQVKGKQLNITALKNCHKRASLVNNQPLIFKNHPCFSKTKNLFS